MNNWGSLKGNHMKLLSSITEYRCLKIFTTQCGVYPEGPISTKFQKPFLTYSSSRITKKVILISLITPTHFWKNKYRVKFKRILSQLVWDKAWASWWSQDKRRKKMENLKNQRQVQTKLNKSSQLKQTQKAMSLHRLRKTLQWFISIWWKLWQIWAVLLTEFERLR